LSIYKLLVRSLWFYRKQHLAIILATILSTAILTGALIVGDSIKYSLRQQVEKRLGATEFVLNTGDRFVRAELARDIQNATKSRAISILSLSGISINPDKNLRIVSTQVIGIDSNFWSFSEINFPKLKNNEAIISQNVAAKLQIEMNDEILLRVENSGLIPANVPFSDENSATISIRLKIVAIADENQLGSFSLKSNQTAPYNVFLQRELLCEKLEIAGKANLILCSEGNNIDEHFLNESLKNIWLPEDATFSFSEISGSGKFEINSKRIFIDKKISNTVLNSSLNQEVIFTYLVNLIKSENGEAPYSFVSAISENIISEKISENEIIINDWLAKDLNTKIGDTLSLKYFRIGRLQTLYEETERFIIKRIIPAKNENIDHSFMPDYPGLTGASQCRQWETNIPIDLKKIRDKDEQYWEEFRGTPKALISIDKAQEIWENDFGNCTAIRFDSSEISQAELQKHIMNRLNPRDLAFEFQAAKSEGIRAANNGVDFGELFLSLSFFVILSGIILIVIIFSLNEEIRIRETAILLSLGFSKKQILIIRLSEYLIVVIFGSILGAFVGVFYNHGILLAINTIWNDIVRTSSLEVHLQTQTLIFGSITGLIISFLTIFIASKRKTHFSIAELLRGNFERKREKRNNRNVLKIGILILSFGASIILVFYSAVSSIDQNSSLFLSAGALFLLGSFMATNILFEKLIANPKLRPLSLRSLSLKNAGRNKFRSLSIVIMLALATFIVFITAANRQTFFGNESLRSSGTGGYNLKLETSIPISVNLNSPEGKQKLGLDDEPIFDSVEFFQMFKVPGNDASCLNLNQVQKPSIIGLKPEILHQRKSFSFAKIINEKFRDNPWQLLEQEYDENIFPAFADQTVITWGLMKKIGDTISYLNQNGQEIKFVLAGGLNSSIFQGNLLISEQVMKQNFPLINESSISLIETPKNEAEKISELLFFSLQNYGVDIKKTESILREFYSVTNTYLSIFMILGGLGLVFGTIGIGIILYRNLLERRSEIALLMALGFKKQKIFKLIFTENFLLLSYGIFLGVLASIISILPSILSPTFSLSGDFLILLIFVVLMNGTLWIFVTLKNFLNKNIISSIRNE